MAHEVNIEKNGVGVAVTLTDVITGMEITRINQYIYDQDPEKKLRYQIWDFTNVDVLEMKTEDIEKLVLQDMEEASINSNQRVALIGSSQTLKGVDSLYHYMSDCLIKTGFQSKTFSTLEEARNWIEETQPVEIQESVNHAQP